MERLTRGRTVRQRRNCGFKWLVGTTGHFEAAAQGH
jgi:hypothetical protein